jgi:hypothetical protein
MTIRGKKGESTSGMRELCVQRVTSALQCKAVLRFSMPATTICATIHAPQITKNQSHYCLVKFLVVLEYILTHASVL